MKQEDLTKGSVFRAISLFALPMLLGNLLQQMYNVVDTWVVGKYISSDALAGVGSAYTLCMAASLILWFQAENLMQIFVSASERTIVAEGVRYLHIEGAFYCGIGCLFLLYGFYRAIGKPAMSLVLTVISLGTRVALAYLLSSVASIRSGGHLVGDPHRMVPGGYGRGGVYDC